MFSFSNEWKPIRRSVKPIFVVRLFLLGTCFRISCDFGWFKKIFHWIILPFTAFIDLFGYHTFCRTSTLRGETYVINHCFICFWAHYLVTGSISRTYFYFFSLFLRFLLSSALGIFHVIIHQPVKSTSVDSYYCISDSCLKWIRDVEKFSSTLLLYSPSVLRLLSWLDDSTGC